MIGEWHEWVLSLGAGYGVNPYVFASIYVGAIPFFFLSIGWLVRRARASRSTVVPTLCAGFCFISAYLYLAIAGRDIPLWVWIMLAALVIYGAWSSIRDTRRKIAEARAEEARESA
jgi:4-hydroxybenzoate polyprenyltransferase